MTQQKMGLKQTDNKKNSSKNNHRFTEPTSCILNLKLKDGQDLLITAKDIIDNNLDKVKESIPNLKISEKLSNSNPLKSVIRVLEDGVQNKYRYYRVISFFIFCYLLTFQILAFYYNSPSANAMILITSWAVYSLIRLQLKPDFEINTMSNIFQRKNLKIFISSIFYILLIISFISIYLKNNCNADFTWEDIGAALFFKNLQNNVYFAYLFIASALISFMIGIYNFQAFYERHIFKIFLKQETVPLKVSGFLLYSVAIIFYPAVITMLCADYSNIMLVAVSVLPYGLLSIFFVSFSVTLIIILKRLAKCLN